MSIKVFSETVPRQVFCVLGNWTSFEVLKEVINKAGFEFDEEYSQLENDDRMLLSFQSSMDRVHPSFTEEDWEGIQNHTAVAYFLTPIADKRESLIDMMGKALVLIRFILEDLGGVAVKSESSGMAHGRSGWLSLYKERIEEKKAKTLYNAFVKRPIGDEYGFYTCGMHLLGLPDILYWFDEDMETEREATKSIDKLAKKIIKFDGDYKKIRSYIEESDSPNFYSKLIECKFYEEDNLYYNPYGYVYLFDEE